MNTGMSISTGASPAALQTGPTAPLSGARPASAISTTSATSTSSASSTALRRYRYHALDPRTGGRGPGAADLPPRRAKRSDGDASTARPAPEGPDIDRLLQLRQPAGRYAADKAGLDATLDYANICSMHNATAGYGLMSRWWARFRGYESANAQDDLDRIENNLRTLFFDTPPSGRAAEWQRISARARRDVNLMIDLGEVIRTSHRPNARASYGHIHGRLAQVLRDEAQADLSLRATDTPGLMALAQTLRAHDAVNSPYFRNRLEIMPGDACAFIKNAISPARADGAIDPAYRRQRERDLCALLYRCVTGNCITLESDPLTLAALRMGIEGALRAEADDQALLADMFAYNGTEDAIYHDGWVLRNAASKTADDLVRYLDAQAPSKFAPLYHAYKLSLVKRKLYALGEYPGDYRFGSIKQAMATVLMRTSNQPPANRYVVYGNATHLETQWTQRMQDEIDNGNMPYMLEIIEAIYSERANGVEKWTARHYRAHYTRLIEAMESAAAGLPDDAGAQIAMRRWLERHMPGWRAASRDFGNTISTEQYAVAIEHAVDVLYRISQAAQWPHFAASDIVAGTGTMEYHPLLKELPFNAQWSLDRLAKAFDYSAFYTEHIIANDDKPAFALIQKMENTHYRTTHELRAAPFWNVETEAYKMLLANGVTVEQMTDAKASIYSNVHTGAYYQRPRPVHEAFIAVIRNVDADALLLLPTGKTIRPYRLIRQSFDEYNKGLPQHPYVIGSALQYMRDRNLPFLPSVRKAQIERIANGFRIARITTESGTQAADELLGSLPIFAPTLQLARASLDGKGHQLYYILLIARDVLATAAMAKMTFGAYITPFISGMRLSASALLAVRMIPGRTMHNVRRYRANSMGYAGFDAPRRKPPQKVEKQHDIPLIGDQSRGYQSRTNRARSGGNAARRIADEQTTGNATLGGVDGGNLGADIWRDLMRIIAPALEQNARQFHSMLKIGRSTQTAMFNMTFNDNIENAGAKAGLKGLTSADGLTWCDGQVLEERQTVRDAMTWQIRSPDDGSYDRRAIHDNVRVELAEGVPAAWAAHPARRYDPLGIIERAFDASPVMRQLFNSYDAQPLNPGSIKITVDTECAAAEVTRHGAAIAINLPADPGCLQFTLNARHVARQSMASAVIENIVTAVTSRLASGDLTPRNPARERGLCIWLANRIRMQTDPHADPRVTAVYYPSREQAQHVHSRKIRDAAELEDQYLERVNPEDPIAARAHAFPMVAGNPTVKAVKALSDRIGLSAHLRSINAPDGKIPAAARPQSASRSRFLDRFRHRFSIEIAHLPAPRGDQLIEASHFFFYECYANSPLFQKVFDYGLGRRDQQWIIFPNGYAGDGGIEYDTLIPAPGIINAAAQSALYLGLIEVQPNPANVSHPLPTSSLRPLESFRRMLDGVIAALIGHNALMSREKAFEHRGAVGWASDMILLEVMQDSETLPNKRLAQITVSANNVEDCRRLRKMASHKREQVRNEDACLDDWFANIGRTEAGDYGAVTSVTSSSMASP